MLLVSALLPICAWASDRPAGMSVHTWVREDIFAGFMANDIERFDRGVAKVDEILQATPANPAALAWRGSADIYRATRARVAGNTAQYRSLLDRGMATMAKARELAPNDVGVLVISAVPVLMADQLDEADRRPAAELGRKTTLAAIKIQEQAMDKLPLHFRGELWSSVAFASDRLGDTATRNEYLKMMIEKLPGTPYERRSQKWLDSGSIATGTYMCLSCHEPGRYEPTLKRLQAAKKQ